MIKLSAKLLLLGMLSAIFSWQLLTLGELINSSSAAFKIPTEQFDELPVSPNPSYNFAKKKALSDYPETKNRPVFFAERKIPTPKPLKRPAVQNPSHLRRPTTRAPKAPPRNAVPPVQLQLMGVMFDEFSRSALIQVGNAKKQWRKEKEKVGNWSIEHIGENAVKLSRNGRTRVLKLYNQSPND